MPPLPPPAFGASTRRSFIRTCAAATVGSGLSLQSAERDRIRIGQIGTGHAHAGGKMDTMRASDAFEVVGIVEPSAARRAHAEKSPTYAGLPWLTEEELFQVPNLRAVAVETEVKDLVPTAQRCIDAGFHVHLDKPGGESFPAFQRLIASAAQRKLVVQMGYMFRYNPAFELCFQLTREGMLGEIFSIECQMSKLLGGNERTALLAYRGGSMFELGCHVIDAVVHLLGRPDRVTPYHRATTSDGFADNQLAVLEYPHATVSVRSALAEVEGGRRRHFVVCGTKGTYEIRPLEPAAARLALVEAQGSWKKGYQDIPLPRRAGRYDGDFADLAAVLRGEKPFGFSAEHDLAVQETLLLASGLPLN